MGYLEKYDANDFCLLDRLKEIKPKCKENTLKEYEKKFWRFKKRFNSPKFGSKKFSFLNATKDIKNELEKYTEGTRKNYLSMLIAIAKCIEMKSNEDVFIDWFNDLRAKTAKPKPMSQKTIDKWITFKQVKETRKYYMDKFEALMKSKSKNRRLLKKDEVDLVNFVVLMLYFSDCERLAKAVNPPRRLEYSNVVVRQLGFTGDKDRLEKDLKERNILYVDEKGMPQYFQFNNYKTHKHYGEHNTRINKRLKRVLNFYFKIHHKLPADLNDLNKENPFWLLPKQNGDPISGNQLGQIIRRTFYGYTKKAPTINTLRSIFTSEVFKHTPKQNHLKGMCLNMGNSLKIQMGYYRKNLTSTGELKNEDIVLSDD